MNAPNGARLVSVLKRAKFGEAPSYIALSQALDADLVGEFEDSWDWFLLSNSKSIIWSATLIDRFKEHWKWSVLSHNEALPWSDHLIESFADRWDWSNLSNNSAIP
jgi:hypothetical protein